MFPAPRTLRIILVLSRAFKPFASSFSIYRCGSSTRSAHSGWETNRNIEKRNTPLWYLDVLQLSRSSEYRERKYLVFEPSRRAAAGLQALAGPQHPTLRRLAERRPFLRHQQNRRARKTFSNNIGSITEASWNAAREHTRSTMPDVSPPPKTDA